MTMHFRDLAEQAAADGAITPEEILALRRAGWSDGTIRPEEAEAIFVINDRLAAPAPQWTDFFVEALCEFLVNGSEPRGYVSEAQGDWLIGRIDHDGRLDSMAELELLAKLLEKAAGVPERVKDFALAQIERAVLQGEGPTRCGGALEAGCISEAEVRLLRRILFAQAGDRPAAVSLREAEMLFRLKDTTLGAANGPGWKQLFVQGVGNYLMGYGGYEPLSPQRAAELDAFMSETSGGVGRIFRSMAKANIAKGFSGLFARETPRDHAGGVAAARAVTTDEQTWLQGRLDGDDRLDDFEEALLAFLRED
jgi:hypothetical protein